MLWKQLELLQWLHYYEQNNDDYSVNQMEVIYLLTLHLRYNVVFASFPKNEYNCFIHFCKL